MSHASKKVQWCLSKAIKEIAETGMHRGLLKDNVDKELAGKHLSKAEHNLKASLYFEKGGYSDWSASAFFYCFYHCFLAILNKHGYSSRNQECTLAVIELLQEEGTIHIDKKFIDALNMTKTKEVKHSIISIREEFQYGVALEFSQKKEFAELFTLCKELMDITQNIVYQ